MKAAYKVLARSEVHACLSADRRIHLRQQRRGHLHHSDATHIDRREKSGQIADHSSTEGHKNRIAIGTVARKLLQKLFDGSEALVRLARWEKQDCRRFEALRYGLPP